MQLITDKLRGFLQYVAVQFIEFPAEAQLKASLVMNLESASSRADQIARQFLAFGNVPELTSLVDRIEEVTPDSVAQLAQNIFSSHPPSLSAVGQLGQLEPHSAIAARFVRSSH